MSDCPADHGRFGIRSRPQSERDFWARSSTQLAFWQCRSPDRGHVRRSDEWRDGLPCKCTQRSGRVTTGSRPRPRPYH